MKRLLILGLLALLPMQLVFARTVEIDVHGMTCPFCVDSLERKFKKMVSVNKVEVSLKLKKVRLETDANAPTIAAIKQAVLDTGFTPTKVTVLDENSENNNTNAEEANKEKIKQDTLQNKNKKTQDK